MNRKIKVILALAVFAAVIFGVSMIYKNLSADYDETPPAPSSQPENTTDVEDSADVELVEAPDFTVTSLDGAETRLSDFRGTPVVVNFWASWCAPCKSELFAFNKVAAEYDGDVAFMMVNLTDGSRETESTLRDFLDTVSYTFPVYMDDGGAANAYGVSGIPATAFIDKDGMLVSGRIGAMSENTLRAELEKIL